MLLNSKSPLLACLLLAFAVLGGCGDRSGQGETVELSSEEHIAKARMHIDRKQLDAAIRELKQALQKDETNPEARFILGELYYENQEMTSAEKELNMAIDLGYDRSEASTLLARVYLAENKNRELQAIELDRLRASDKGTVLALQGTSLINTGYSEKGKELVAQAVRLAPSNEEARLKLARLLADDDDLVGARPHVETLLTTNDENYDAWMLLGDIEFIEGHMAGAEEAYTEAMAVAINPTEARLKRAKLRIEQNDFEGAQADVNELLKNLPNSPSVHYVQGVIYFHQEKYKEATESLLIAEKDDERHPEALLYAGISHHKLGNNDRALNYANQYNSIKPGTVYGRRLLALIAISMGEYDRAERELRFLLDANPEDVVTLNLLANTLLAQGNTEAGLDLLSKLEAMQPDSPVALGRLGAGQLLAGQRSLGIEKLEAALAMDPSFEQAEILVVLNYVQQRAYDKALAAAETFRSRNPNSTQPLNLLGRVYIETGQSDKARQAYTDALKIESANATAHHGLALLDIVAGDYGSAKAHYDAVLAENQDYLPTLIKLAELSARQNEVEAMLAYLQRAMEKHPEQVAPRILLANYYLSIKKPEQVSLLIADMPEELRTHSEILNLTALVQLAEKDYISAKFTIDELQDRLPGSAQVYYLKALLHAALNEKAAMAEQLKKTLELEPNYTAARFMIARLYLSEGDADSAEPHIEKLTQLVPGSTDLMLLEAASANARGNPQAAVGYAEHAFATAPNTVTLLQLVSYLHELGQYEREKQLLTRWLADNPGDTQARITQANVYALLEDYDSAIAQYREVLQRDGDNVTALNNLAWYLKERSPQEALQFAQRLAELDPESAAAQDTLAMVLLNNGETKKAGWAINRALEQDPENPSVQYHSALINAKAGKRDVALELLEFLLGSDAPFAERAEAEALLQQMKNEG